MSESVCPDPVEFVAPQDVYVPINAHQIDNLIGRMLTLIDALGLQSGQGKAVKDLARNDIRAWFNTARARENAETSYRTVKWSRTVPGLYRGVETIDDDDDVSADFDRE